MHTAKHYTAAPAAFLAHARGLTSISVLPLFPPSLERKTTTRLLLARLTSCLSSPIPLHYHLHHPRRCTSSFIVSPFNSFLYYRHYPCRRHACFASSIPNASTPTDLPNDPSSSSSTIAIEHDLTQALLQWLKAHASSQASPCSPPTPPLLGVRPSSIPNAGRGLWLNPGQSASKGDILTLYPGMCLWRKVTPVILFLYGALVSSVFVVSCSLSLP